MATRKPIRSPATPAAARKPRTTRRAHKGQAAVTPSVATVARLAMLAEPLEAEPPVAERLGSHGRQCWQRIAPLLVDLRLLTPLDLEALEALCHQWDDYLTWHLAIQRDPSLAIVEYESGARQKSPEASLRDSAYDRWLKLLPRFGLSPEHLRKLRRLKEPSGSRGGSPGQVETDPVAEFARQKYVSE